MTFSRRTALGLVLLFLCSRLIVVISGTIANVALPANEGEEFKHLLDGGPALDMWYRWDAGFYATIATDGYKWWNERRPDGDMAFLPLYPAAVSAVMTLSTCGFSPYASTCATVAGVIVSNAALLGAVFLLFDLTRRRFDEPTAWRAVVFLLAAPSAVFLSGVYTEALFLLLVLGVFVALDRRVFWAAVLLASLAVLTRSVGLALYPALLWTAWQSSGDTPKRALRLLLAHVPVAVFGAYILFAGLTVGEPLAYFSSYASIWERDVTRAPWETLLVYFSGQPVSLYGFDPAWIDLVAFVAAVVGSILVLRLDRSWGLFSLAAALIPFMSGTLIGMPRFVSVIFPLYILLAVVLRLRWQFALAGAVSSALALFVLVRFVTWRWTA